MSSVKISIQSIHNSKFCSYYLIELLFCDCISFVKNRHEKEDTLGVSSFLVGKRSAERTAPASGGALLHIRERPALVFSAYTLFFASSQDWCRFDKRVSIPLVLLLFPAVLADQTVVFPARELEVNVEAQGHDQEDEEEDAGEQDPRPRLIRGEPPGPPGDQGQRRQKKQHEQQTAPSVAQLFDDPVGEAHRLTQRPCGTGPEQPPQRAGVHLIDPVEKTEKQIEKRGGGEHGAGRQLPLHNALEKSLH